MKAKLFIAFLVSFITTSWLFIELVVKPKKAQNRDKPYVLIWETPSKPTYYPVIPGSDVAMPFAKGAEARSKVIGFSRLLYVEVPGTTMKDRRYPTLFK